MTGVVRASPREFLRGENFVLACWSLAHGGNLDRQRGLVSIGSVRGETDRWDLAETARLLGEYALIIGQPNGLLLTRGRHAGRCLYFVRGRGGSLVACSRLEPLLACAENVSPNARCLGALILATNPDDLSATPVEGVHRIGSSQVVVIGPHGAITARDVPLEFRTSKASPGELADELQSMLRRAVGRAIHGARRVAVLTSGGLDSSSVLATAVAEARGANPSEVDAVNLSFASPGDDRPYLRDLCDSLGVVPMRILPHEASSDVLRALTADASPVIWPTAGWHYVAARRMRDRGVDLVLTGQGGDLVFGGDPRLLASRAWSRDWYRAAGRVWRFERQTRSTSLLRTVKLLVTPPVQAHFPVLSRLKRHRAALRKWAWAGPRLRELVRNWVEEPIDRDWANPTGAMKFQRCIKTEFLRMAESCGQMEAATGLRRLDPLLDDELVSLVASFPQEALLYGSRPRGLLRHAMGSVLPDSLRLRSDKARFESAIFQMVSGSDLGALRDLSQMRMLGDLGLVDPPRYRRHFEDVLSKGAASTDWLAIWPALSAEAFVRSRWGPHARSTP